MKDLKTILEVGHSKSTNDNKTVSISLNKEAAKTFGKEELEDLGIEDNIEKV